MKNTTKTALILSTLMAVAGIAHAQVPNTMKGGEATTMSGGQSNPVDKSPRTSDTTRAEVRSEAAAANRDKANTVTQGGTASTMVNGRPNAIPKDQNAAASGMSTSRESKRAEGRAAAKATPAAAETAK